MKKAIYPILLFIFLASFLSHQGIAASVSTSGSSSISSKVDDAKVIKDTSIILSATSHNCSEGDGTENSGAGEGKVGQVNVCDGEDWWLPESVSDSNDHGDVIARGKGIDCLSNEHVTMNNVMSYWYNMVVGDADGDGTIESGEGSVIEEYENVDTEKKHYETELNQITYGQGSDKYIEESLFLGSEEGVAPAYLQNLGAASLEEQFTDWINAAESTTEQNNISKLWDAGDGVGGVSIYGLQSHSNSIYLTPFWDPIFLQERTAFIENYGNYINTLTNDDGQNFASFLKQINFNSENCYVNSYHQYELLDIDELDDAVESLVATAQLDSANPPVTADKWLFNICNGGRAYFKYAQAAKKYGTGLGRHGFGHTTSLLYQSLFDNTYYDTELKTYRPTGRFPYEFSHIDETYIHQNDNTYGNYRMTRQMATSAVAMGVNRILINGGFLPSQNRYIIEGLCHGDVGPGWDWDGVSYYEDETLVGCYMGSSNYYHYCYTCNPNSDEYDAEDCADKNLLAEGEEWDENQCYIDCDTGTCTDAGRAAGLDFCNYDYEEIADQNSDKFLLWLKKIIGVPADQATEAYVSLAQMGSDIPENNTSEDFTNYIDTCLNDKDWGQLGSVEGCSWKYWVKYPVLSYFGRHADLDQTIEGGQGTPVLRMNDNRLNGDTVPDPESNGTFGYELDANGDFVGKDCNAEGSNCYESQFYEGKRTDHPINQILDDDPAPFQITTSNAKSQYLQHAGFAQDQFTKGPRNQKTSPDITFTPTSKYNYYLYFKLADDFVRPGTEIPEVPAKFYSFNNATPAKLKIPSSMTKKVLPKTNPTLGVPLATYGSIKNEYSYFDSELPEATRLKNNYVIKVFFENYTGYEGTWRLEYDGVDGWTEAPIVTMEAENKGIQTATFKINDAYFANRGKDGADFAIHTLTGYSPAFLHVRIIKVDKFQKGTPLIDSKIFTPNSNNSDEKETGKESTGESIFDQIKNFFNK